MRLPLELALTTTETRETSTGVEIDVTLSVEHWDEHLPIWTYTAQVADPDVPEGMSGASLAHINRQQELDAENAALAQARRELAARLEEILTPVRQVDVRDPAVMASIEQVFGRRV